LHRVTTQILGDFIQSGDNKNTSGFASGEEQCLLASVDEFDTGRGCHEGGVDRRTSTWLLQSMRSYEPLPSSTQHVYHVSCLIYFFPNLRARQKAEHEGLINVYEDLMDAIEAVKRRS
jgi:hypothetical protein